MAEEKTNVMRILEQKKCPYAPHSYPHGSVAVGGAEVAQLLGKDPARVFKTLVTRGASGAHYVCVIPVLAELDFKKTATFWGEKSLTLLPLAQLTPLTGYVRGGCSPIGMKKKLATVFDDAARAQATILLSAGRVGAQVEAEPQALAALISARFGAVTV